MTTLILQSALLLAAAYFIGAWVACIVRRRFYAIGMEDRVEGASATIPVGAAIAARAQASAPQRRPDPERIAPKIETIQRPAQSTVTDAASRYEKALTTAPVPAAPVTQASTPASVAPPAPVVAAQPPSVPLPPQARPSIPAPAPSPANTAGAIAAAAAAGAAVVRAATPAAPMPGGLPVASSSTGQSTVSAPIAAPGTAPIVQNPAVPTLAPALADDLTRIRAIDPALLKRLAQLGISRYRDIAGWSTADVARVSSALGFKGRIEQENWIEQAQILARGGETAFARRVDRGEVVTPSPASGPVSVTAPPTATALKPATVVTPAAVLPSTPGPEVANRAAFASKGTPLAPQTTTVPSAGLATGMAAAAASAAAAGMGAVSGLARDNLQRIGGINAEVEKLLNVQGVSKYAHVGNWSPNDATRFDRLLGSEGRIARENWVEQAQMLARGGDTAFSRQYDHQRKSGAATIPSVGASVPSVPDVARPSKLIDAIRDTAGKVGNETSASRPAGDLSGLRSVRSEAFTGGQGSQKSGTSDDLKRIRGVGVLIEKKLNSMGVTSYAQVANWTAADIDRASQVLDFRGRIERENWVEQARILSAGGQTEFSRRVDRGDVETSRNKP